MKEPRITHEEFLALAIDKELELANAPVRYKDISGENKEKHLTWFDDYTLTEEQYKEWEKFCLEKAKLIKGFSRVRKSQLDQAFGYFALQFGLKVERNIQKEPDLEMSK